MKKKIVPKLIIAGALCLAVVVGIGLPIWMQPQAKDLAENKNSSSKTVQSSKKQQTNKTNAELEKEINTSNKQVTAKTTEEYKEILEKHKDEIPEKDLQDGYALKAKIDVNYISRLKAGGKVEPDKGPLIPYLRSKLNDEEFNRFLELYSKYQHFLEE